jgi:hypothetical protein
VSNSISACRPDGYGQAFAKFWKSFAGAKNKTRLFLEGLEIWRPCAPYSVLNDKNRHCQSDKIRPSDRCRAGYDDSPGTTVTIRLTALAQLFRRSCCVPEKDLENKAP